MDEWEGTGDAARAEIGPLGGRGRCELAGHLWGPDLLSQDMGMLAPKENRGLGPVSKAGSLKSTCPLFPLTASNQSGNCIALAPSASEIFQGFKPIIFSFHPRTL